MTSTPRPSHHRPEPEQGFAQTRAVILGIGNTLLTDDGVGVHVARAVQGLVDAGWSRPGLRICDGGTVGLELLSWIEPQAPLIAVDAAELGAPPGTVTAFTGAAMDEQLSGTKRTAHEVALSDLVQAAWLSSFLPERRALIAVQPEVTTWGLEPTEAVAAAIPEAVEAILELLEHWPDGS